MYLFLQSYALEENSHVCEGRNKLGRGLVFISAGLRFIPPKGIPAVSDKTSKGKRAYTKRGPFLFPSPIMLHWSAGERVSSLFGDTKIFEWPYQETGVRKQESEHRNQNTGIRTQESEHRNQNTGIRIILLAPVCWTKRR